MKPTGIVTQGRLLAIPGEPVQRPSSLRRSEPLALRIIHWAYYLLLFSIPFETVPLGVPGSASLTKLVGLALPLVAWPLPSVCFRRPPRAFWCFAAALLAVIVLGCFQPRILWPAIVRQVFTSAQLLVTFWISWSLMRDPRIAERTLLVLGASCTTLASLQVLGITETHQNPERTSVLGFNPNEVAAILSIGLLVLIGLAYGRREGSAKRRRLALVGLVLVGGVIVSLGSRGASLALAMGLLGLLFKRTTLPSRLVLILGGVGMVGLLVVASYNSEPIRLRWERTIQRGDLAGRDAIYAKAWPMFMERPIFGWGPVTHYHQLGYRLGLETRDPHNTYLWVLNESGLFGAIPFLVGLGLCWRAAWVARRGAEGGLPIALMICISAVSMKGTYHFSKVFWIVLAYVLASGMSGVARPGANRGARTRRAMALPVRLMPTGSLTTPRAEGFRRNRPACYREGLPVRSVAPATTRGVGRIGLVQWEG